MLVVGGQVDPLLAAHVAQARAVGAAQGTRVDEGDDGVAQLRVDVDRVALADDEEIVGVLVLVVGGGQGGGSGLEVDLRAGDVVVLTYLVQAAHALAHQVDGGRDLHEDAVLDAGQVHGHVQRRAGLHRHRGRPQVIGGDPRDVFVERRPQRARQARQG